MTLTVLVIFNCVDVATSSIASMRSLKHSNCGVASELDRHQGPALYCHHVCSVMVDVNAATVWQAFFSNLRACHFISTENVPHMR